MDKRVIKCKKIPLFSVKKVVRVATLFFYFFVYLRRNLIRFSLFLPENYEKL